MKRILSTIVGVALIAATLTACDREPCPQGQHWEDRGNYTTQISTVNGKTTSRAVWHSRWMCVA